MEELRASRVRLVEAGGRRRAALLLRAAQRRAGDDRELAGLLDEAQEELRTGLAELRELARGIHPAVLTQRGLEPALQSLVSRAPVPVEVEAPRCERLPDAVESAAYFVVARGSAGENQPRLVRGGLGAASAACPAHVNGGLVRVRMAVATTTR
jgi:hypothetical protein